MINMYTSLAYCIQITLDNLDVNPFMHGEYSDKNLRRPLSFWEITKRYALHMTYMNHNQYGIYNDIRRSSDSPERETYIMITQRLKWLTYGLHLRVWYADNYLIYSNYKRLMYVYNNDESKVVERLYELRNPIPLFSNIRDGFQMVLPNVGLALYPTAGSLTILTSFRCFYAYFTEDVEKTNVYFSRLLQHGFKDLLVGDSMCSVLKEREKCMTSLLETTSKIFSFNNVNGEFNCLYTDIPREPFEIALASNLHFIFKNVIAPYFLRNKNDILILNSLSNSTFDETTFENVEDIPYSPVFSTSWCARLLFNILKSNDKNKYFGLIGKLIMLHKLGIENLKGDESELSRYYKKFNKFSLMTANLVNDYQKGIDSVSERRTNQIFPFIMEDGFYSDRKYSVGNILWNLWYSMFGFEDYIVGGCKGISLFAMYESPMMLMIYNNVNFMLNFIPPTGSELYDVMKDKFVKFHVVMRRIIIEMTYRSSPIKELVLLNL